MTMIVTAWLLSASIKGSLLVAMALLVSRLTRNRIPSRWLCALLLLAMLRLLMPVAPAAPFSAFNLLRDATETAPRFVRFDNGPAPAPRMRFQTAPLPNAPPSRRWMLPLLAIWLAGVSLFAVRVLVRTFTFRRQMRHARVIHDPEVLRLIDEGRDTLRVHRNVRVLESSAVSTPSLHGWLQPALLLPEDFLASFSAEQVRYVILHELAHVRRSDVLVNWIVTAAHALHWFNPLIHLAIARLAEERELACDALALAALRDHERSAYGGTVLELVDRLRPNAMVPAVVGMTTTKRQLHRRIQMIATFRQSRYSLLFAIAVIAIGMVTLTDATAGERRMFQRIQTEPLSPAIQATLDKLETKLSIEFQSTSVPDIVNAVSNASGAIVQYEDGALTDEVRAARVSLKATDVPAHLVLLETLASVNLAARFTESGVLVEKIPAGEQIFTREVPPPTDADDGVPKDRIMIVSAERAPAGSGEIRVHAADAKDGRRTIHFAGKDGESGTFEFELKREQ